MLRIGIVDDHSVVRAGLREILHNSGDKGLQVVFEAGSGEAALEALRETACDVLLLDISLPGKNGLEVLQVAQRDHPKLRVLILSSYPEDRYALASIRQGAHGYLCKDCDSAQLVQAIHTIAGGGRYVSQRTACLLTDGLTGDGVAQPHESLSARELQVFLCLARGDSVSRIAQVLNLSTKTVSTYRSRLLRKTGVSSNAELAAYAVRHGLIER